MAEYPAAPNLEGYLLKLKQKSNLLSGSWNKRYFFVDTIRREFGYCNSESSRTMKCSIHLDDITAVLSHDDNHFQVESKRRNFFLRASTKLVASGWIHGLDDYRVARIQYEKARKAKKDQEAIRRQDDEQEKIHLKATQAKQNNSKEDEKKMQRKAQRAKALARSKKIRKSRQEKQNLAEPEVDMELNTDVDAKCSEVYSKSQEKATDVASPAKVKALEAKAFEIDHVQAIDSPAYSDEKVELLDDDAPESKSLETSQPTEVDTWYDRMSDEESEGEQDVTQSRPVAKSHTTASVESSSSDSDLSEFLETEAPKDTRMYSSVVPDANFLDDDWD